MSLLAGDRVYQHAARDGRDGDGRLEADGRLSPPPHSGGFQGAGQSADSAYGTAAEEAEISSSTGVTRVTTKQCDNSHYTV